MALETLNNRYGIRHFDEGGTTNDPIAGLYSSVLGRDTPDAEGLAYWQGALSSGQSLADIESAFRSSPEYQQNQQASQTTGGGNVTVQSAGPQYDNAQPIAPTYGSTGAIQNWYETNLGRPAEQDGLNFWSQSFGDTLDPNEILQLQQSPEYTNRLAVSNYYDTELGRNAAEDKAGLDYWSNLANSGTSLEDIRKGISGSTEGQTYDLTQLYKNEFDRAPDVPGLEYWQNQLASGTSLEDIQKSFNESKEGIGYDIGNLYENVLGRKPDEIGLKFWLDAVDKGIPREEILNSFQQAPEYQVAEDYQKYLGRAPEGAGSQYYQEQLAAGRDPREIEREIAWSQESIGANSPSVKAVLEATLGKNIVDQLTPEQISEYTKTILDPARVYQAAPVSQADFNADYYLEQNPDVAASGLDPYQHYTQYGFNEGRAASDAAPTYATQDDNLRAVYEQIALDPVLGAKLREENPELWEKVTPLQNRPDEYVHTERTGYGQYGTVDIEGYKVPILNAARADQILGGAENGTFSDFSHGRGNYSKDLGWSNNSFSGKLAKGADALGVTRTETQGGSVPVIGPDGEYVYDIDPYTGENYGLKMEQSVDVSYKGLNEAADLLGIDKSQFNGNEDALYDAVSSAAKDYYLYTGDSLTPGQGSEGGANSFNTVLYQRNGDELIPISKPVEHGGMQNRDVYDPTSGKGWGVSSGAITGTTMVAAAALTALTAGTSAPLTMGAIGSAVTGGVAAGTTAAFIGGAVVATALAAGSIAGSGNVITGSNLLPATIAGGVGASMGPLLQSSDTISSAANSIAASSNGLYTAKDVTNIIGSTLATTMATAARSGANGDQILKSFTTGLISNGISTAAASQITKGLQDIEGLSKDNIAKIARAGQLVSGVASTAALSGRNQDQIMQSIITQIVNPSSIAQIAGAKGTPPKIEPTNPFGTENVGLTSGSVDSVLQSQIMDGIANNTDDPIAFMQAARNWTGDGSKNVEYVTTEMVRQGIPANQISADLQELYRIPADKADQYANYMFGKLGSTTTAASPTVAPVTQPTTAPTTRELTRDREAGRNIPSTTPPAGGTKAPLISGMSYTPSASSPINQLNFAQSPAGNQNIANLTTSGNMGPASGNMAFVGQTLPYAPAALAASGVGSYIPTAAQVGSVLDPIAREAATAARVLGGIGMALYPSELGSGTLTREQIAAQDAIGRLPYSERTDEVTGVPGKPIGVDSFRIPSSVPTSIPPPSPILGEAAPAPEGFADVPSLPMPTPAGEQVGDAANAPNMFDPTLVGARPDVFTPSNMGTVIAPTAPAPERLPIPPILPGTEPAISPETQPAIAPNVRPGEQPAEQPLEQPAVETAPNADVAVTPQVQSAIQTVARTQAQAQALTQAVPMVTTLITQGVPRAIAIPRVAIQVGVPVQDLTTVIDVAIPEVAPTPTPAPSVPAPSPSKPASKPSTPTTTAGGYGIISPFLMQQYGGIQDLAPGLTEGGKYSLSGIPSTDLNMNPMIPNSPLQQFAATSPASPLELGDENQDQEQEPLRMATGGTVAQQQAYNPYDISTGISGSLTPGLTKARLDYLLTGLPQSHAEGGIIGHNPQFFSEGGLGSMENTFVEGEGDGTSDQVPAMLANGEFVIPADVVSGLGNGSNDAGAEVLQEFLKVIREHKHSAEANKLPPKSKGPLAYLTNAKRKVKVA